MESFDVKLSHRDVMILVFSVTTTINRLRIPNTVAERIVVERYTALRNKLDDLLDNAPEPSAVPVGVGVFDSNDQAHAALIENERKIEAHAPVGLTDPFNQPAESQADGVGEDEPVCIDRLCFGDCGLKKIA